MNDDILGNVGLIVGAVSFYTHNFVNGYTMAKPSRSKFEIWVVALVAGSLITVIAAIARAIILADFQIAAQLALVAMLAASGSAGAALTQTSAQAAQQAARPNATDPDPGTPQPTTRQQQPVSLPTGPGQAEILDFPTRRIRSREQGADQPTAVRASALGGTDANRTAAPLPREGVR